MDDADKNSPGIKSIPLVVIQSIGDGWVLQELPNK
jgi:hypothetical protein